MVSADTILDTSLAPGWYEWGSVPYGIIDSTDTLPSATLFTQSSKRGVVAITLSFSSSSIVPLQDTNSASRST